MPQPSQVTTYPSRVWDPGSKTFVENVNRELSSDQLTTVAVKDTNEVVGFPDGMAVDEMEHAIKGDLNGVIRPWKMSFYEKNIQQPLAKLGMSSFQPRFITEIKPTAERAFVTSFARAATADILKPDFSEKEAAAYPKEAFAGSLAGSIIGLKGVGLLLKSVKLPTMGAYAARVLGKLPGPAQKAIVAAGSNAAVGGAYRAVSETANEIRDEEHPEIAQIGKAALHDALWFGAAGGVASPLSKVPGAATTGGIFYLMAKADGASEVDALLNAGVGAGFHIVSGSHGQNPKIRKTVVENVEKSVSDYIQAKNPLIDVHVAQQAGREHVYLKAEQVLSDLAKPDNLVRGKDGKPIELNVDAQGKDAVQEVLKSKEATTKMLENIADDVINPEGKSASGETPQTIAENQAAKLKQFEISRKDALARGDKKAVAKLDKLIAKNQPETVEIPEFKNTEEAIAFGEKHKDNPAVLESLKANRAEIQARYKKLSEDPKATPEMEKEAFRLAQVAQFPREALEAAAGKISKDKAKNAIDKIKGKGLGGESGQTIIPGVDVVGEKIAKATTPENRENVYQRVFNRFQSIENVVERAKAMGAKIRPGEDAGVSADRYLSTANQAENVLRDGTYRITKGGKIEVTGEGLKPILDQFSKKYKGEEGEADLNGYLISRRTIEDLQRPKDEFSNENIATPEQVKKAEDYLAKLKQKHGDLGEFENTAQRIYDYQKRVLENLVDSGLLSSEKLLVILEKNPHYIPFDRIMPEEPAAGGTPTAKKLFSSVKSPIKKIKGSELEIHDPIESVIKNTYRIMDAANRNRVFRDIYDLKDIEGLGINAKRPDFRAIEVSAEETGATDITIFRPSQFTPKGNVVEGFINGKRKYLEVTDNIKQAMTGLNDQSSSMLAKMLSYPATWLRTGATLTPEFMLRNPIRDQWTALLQTQVGYRPFLDAGGAIADIMGKSKIYNDWIRSGGSYAGFVELSRPALQKMAAELRGKPDMLRKLNIVSTMQDISQLMEQATRLGVYKAAIRKGLSPVEAARQSRESTINFARRGTQTKDLNAVIAFFNAGIQGLDKSVRVIAKDPQGFTVKALATITVPSILFYLKNRQDEDYAELPRWQKDLFWMTKIGDTWWRIPKPFLYGQVFGSIPERFMEYLDTKDPDSFDKLQDSLYNALSPIAGDPMSGLLPTAVKPLIENMTNWSFFRGRNIVPDSRKQLIPQEQFSQYDTKTARMLGAILKVSPSKIENLVSGWLGGSGRYALQSGDLFMETVDKMRGKAPEEKKPVEKTDLPLVKGFAAKTPAGYQSESVQKFFDAKDKITALKLTHRKYEKDGDYEKADNFINKNPEIEFYSSANNIADHIADLNKDVESVSKDPDLSDNQKRELIKSYQQQMTELAREFNKELKTKGEMR